MALGEMPIGGGGLFEASNSRCSLSVCEACGWAALAVLGTSSPRVCD